MNVLSLFDGMSCGQIALERAGIHVDNYYSSEIDKYAIKVTQANYPSTIQLGDINDWQSWELPKIDLVIGGSPCQGLSFAGKQLAFDDPRSKLFFKFVDILGTCKPKYYLLENVRMKKESLDVISTYLGEPMCINSALVSAQNRVRYYWSNIYFDPPEDRGILLKDIVLGGFVDRKKSYCIDACYYKGGNLKQYFEKSRRQLIFIDKEKMRNIVYKKNYIQWDTSGKGHGSQDHRSYYLDTKHGSLPNARAGTKEKVFLGENIVRKLAPIECERLQTVPDNYTKHVSDSQRYKMLGNGWTVDVISHIFKWLL